MGWVLDDNAPHIKSELQQGRSECLSGPICSAADFDRRFTMMASSLGAH
jgi:hypothetical protein